MAAEPSGRFTAHGPMTDPDRHAAMLDGLPDGVDRLIRTVQGLLIHDAGLHLYGLTAADFAGASRATRRVAERLSALAPRPLTEARAPADRIFGTCRDYALMLTGFLRHKGVPARVRCGFATYFGADRFADHWICEHWVEAESRWARADAQLDGPHRAELGIGFDIADMPHGAFLTAGEAWRLMRGGTADAAAFGHGEHRGAWFMRVNLMRDLLAVRGEEASDWDRWREVPAESRPLDTGAWDWCDAVAAHRDGDLSAGEPVALRQPFWLEAAAPR